MASKANVLMIGDFNVGKSTLIKYKQTGFFCDVIIPTIDLELSTIILPQKGLQITVKDTPGMREGSLKHERFLIPEITKCSVIIFVYDKTYRASFDWIDNIKAIVDVLPDSRKEFILVGNKCDEADNVVITTEEGQNKCTHLEMDFFIETSAKDGTNVDELFLEAALRLKNMESKTELKSDESKDSKGWCRCNCECKTS